jgi:hypothetical protein
VEEEFLKKKEYSIEVSSRLSSQIGMTLEKYK